ncbi:ATPase [Plasmodium yoelii]|uniref:AAA family ATPase n=3 Tax=Plasmodium yoelii TaxID=5861 RepID=A0AAE9WQK2_PLAYO|nr:ATPase [Plasmodium yoelii]EAA20891.1 ATPase, AAA family, putative [Plasmodium yoelii yoelii]WBY58105.1 AAA family ATPase [Plasmodium yoelii yoelii]CDU85153.1 AAA family ATPase, putative [Plasmodium yoelii]VTZ79048.1 AAA family ATPase, putative [Plasmodium yoelii]|eukprot:XP_729326.1 ATPase [Plasmodium yoelii]
MVKIKFFYYENVEEDEGGEIASDFNVYCTNDLFKLLDVKKNDNAIICHTNENKKGENENFYVYCCFKGIDEINTKSNVDRNCIYTNKYVLKSLNLDIEDEYKKKEKNIFLLNIKIIKSDSFVPIKELKLCINEIYNKVYDHLKDYCYSIDNNWNSNSMLENFWKNIKNKNFEKYINLSLLNTCLFPNNFIKISILGTCTFLSVLSLTIKKNNKNINFDTLLKQNVFQIPYIDQRTKIIIQKNDIEQMNFNENVDKNTNVDPNILTNTDFFPKKKGLNKIGGYKKIKEDIYYYILLPLLYKNIYDQFNIDVNKGVLFHGPPGCGKTFLALAIKEELIILQKKINSIKKKSNLSAQQMEIQINDQKESKSKKNNSIDVTSISTEIAKNDDIEFLIPDMEIFKSNDLIDNNNSGMKINELFLRCYKRYKEQKKCSIIFIDEIEILCEKRENSNINLYTTTLLNNMDGVRKNTHTILIGATNYINKLDLALRRSGRFDVEIEISLPNLKDRISILKKKLYNINHNINNKQIKKLADICQSFTCSDINSLINVSMYINLRENGVLSKNILNRSIKKKLAIKKTKNISEEENQTTSNKILNIDNNEINLIKNSEKKNNFNQNECVLKYDHITKGLKYVKPSGMKELYIDIPKTRIKDIGGYKIVKQCIKECLIYPKIYKKLYEKYNIQTPKGILLYGPPGCSKTLFAKAIASEINMNFISVKGPEIFSKYVGESEKTIRDIFKKARENSPCVIFFDEIDSIASNRNLNQNFVSNRVLCQLLNEIDGITIRADVIILGATNRPDLIDPAALRPGRFDRIIYVPLPNYKSRFSILKKTLKLYKISDVDNNGESLKMDNSIEQTQVEESENLQSQNEKHYFEGNIDSFNTKNMNPIKSEISKVIENNKFTNKINSIEKENEKYNSNDNNQKKPKRFTTKKREKINDNSQLLELCYFLAKKTKKYSGAEIVNICREASICALRETLKIYNTEKKGNKIDQNVLSTNSFVGLSKKHFIDVLKTIKPQTSSKLIKFYKNYNEQKKS